jgi:hypothetical protein
VEARGRDRVGESLEEVNAMRGSASSHRLTPACMERTSRMRKPLEPGLEQALSWPATIEPTETARRAGPVERRARYRGGETSESGNPRAQPARNKAGRLRAEQGVKRLRKPVGAAQSGEANPAWVAARFWKRRRVQKPHGRRLGTHHSHAGASRRMARTQRLSRCDIESNRVKDDTVVAVEPLSTAVRGW